MLLQELNSLTISSRTEPSLPVFGTPLQPGLELPEEVNHFTLNLLLQQTQQYWSIAIKEKDYILCY